MPAVLSHSRTQLWIVLAAAASIVLARSAAFLIWQHAGFDSDQAIAGLMAKHITEGRAFPLFIYGQQYLLGVEPWLAVPFFAVLGPSVAALKLPIVIVNAVTAVLLVWVLHRDGGLRPWIALLVSAFYVLAPPTLSKLLVESGGGNSEPLLYVLVLWLLRGRPLLFGIVLGIAFLHREFTVYAVTAIVALALLERPRITADRARTVALVAIGYTMVYQAAQAAFLYSTPNGPASAISAPLGAGANVGALLGRVCWDFGTLGPAVANLFWRYLAIAFGMDENRLAAFGINTLRPGGLAGLPSLWPLLRLLLLVAFIRSVWLSVRDRAPIWTGRAAVGAFLLLIGLQSAVLYAFARCGRLEVVTFRYTLLALYIGVGILTLFFIYERHRVWRYSVGAIVLLWCVVTAGAHVGLVREFVRTPPRSAPADLASYLVSHGIRYAEADYWTAYYATFMANEQVVIASADMVRIEQYQQLFMDHLDQAVIVFREPCTTPGGQEIVPGHYWVCP